MMTTDIVIALGVAGTLLLLSQPGLFAVLLWAAMLLVGIGWAVLDAGSLPALVIIMAAAFLSPRAMSR